MAIIIIYVFSLCHYVRQELSPRNQLSTRCVGGWVNKKRTFEAKSGKRISQHLFWRRERIVVCCSPPPRLCTDVTQLSWDLSKLSSDGCCPLCLQSDTGKEGIAGEDKQTKKKKKSLLNRRQLNKRQPTLFHIQFKYITPGRDGRPSLVVSFPQSGGLVGVKQLHWMWFKILWQPHNSSMRNVRSAGQSEIKTRTGALVASICSSLSSSFKQWLSDSHEGLQD